MSFRFLIAVSVFFRLAAAAATVWAHAYPAVSVPADGAVLRETPREIRIQFTEGVELEFSRIEVKDGAGKTLSQGKIRRPAEDTLAVDLKPLPRGAYTIEWQVLSVDTHVTEGVIRFTVSQ